MENLVRVRPELPRSADRNNPVTTRAEASFKSLLGLIFNPNAKLLCTQERAVPLPSISQATDFMSERVIFLDKVLSSLGIEAPSPSMTRKRAGQMTRFGALAVFSPR